MTRNVKLQLLEIDNFVATYSCAAIAKDSPNRLLFEVAYKDFHCILIWQQFFDELSHIPSELKTTFNEAVSDISQSFLCCLMSSYKPSRMMLRSAVENAIRVAVDLSGKNAKNHKNVFKLIEEFKDCPISQGPAKSAAQSFTQIYGELCNYVHSSTPMHMDLRIPFSHIASLNQGEQKACMILLQQFCQASNRIMYCLLYVHLNEMHHLNADWVRDRLPAALKKKVTGLMA